MTTGLDTNIAIFEAWGIDPSRIRPNATIRFDKLLGPVLSVEWMLLHNGKHYSEDGETVTAQLRRYRLVPIEEPVEDEDVSS